ncbi:MAG TPA: GNAT family N-acetyltransferase [Gemmatimonadaceae bacterium]|nr:GNAT family N-acetyltransferase [Gemmatimonadaceae bacterium]
MHVLQEITISRAAESDVAALAEFGRRTFDETFGPHNTPSDMEAFLSKTFGIPQQTAEVRDPDRAMIVAKDGAGTLVGYALVHRGSTEHCVTAARPAEVRRIYVDSSLHGRNVGAQLMGACIEQSRAWGCDAIWLGVWERNPRAIAFYEKQGFRTVGSHDFWVGSDRQRDHIMLKPLD